MDKAPADYQYVVRTPSGYLYKRFAIDTGNKKPFLVAETLDNSFIGASPFPSWKLANHVAKRYKLTNYEIEIARIQNDQD